jgi:hypothetical protein
MSCDKGYLRLVGEWKALRALVVSVWRSLKYLYDEIGDAW